MGSGSVAFQGPVENVIVIVVVDFGPKVGIEAETDLELAVEVGVQPISWIPKWAVNSREWVFTRIRLSLRPSPL